MGTKNKKIKKGFSTPVGLIPTLCQNFMEICSLVSEKNGNKHTERQTNRHTNIGFPKRSFSAHSGPIPTLCPNFMEISSLVSEKNGNKQTYIQTNKQKRENKQTHKHRIYKKKKFQYTCGTNTYLVFKF